MGDPQCSNGFHTKLWCSDSDDLGVRPRLWKPPYSLQKPQEIMRNTGGLINYILEDHPTDRKWFVAS